MTALAVALALSLAVALVYALRLRRQLAGRIPPGLVASPWMAIATQQAAQIAQLKAVAANYDAAVATLAERLAWEKAVRAAVGLLP